MNRKIILKICCCAFIVGLMFLIGSLISKNISEGQKQKEEIYDSAIRITTTEELQEAMNNKVEHCFIYGELKAVDPITCPEIEGEYAYIQKVTKEYKMHTRRNTYTDKDGKKHTEKERYWSWDRINSSSSKCTSMSLCGIEFSSEKINLPSSTHIDTIYNGSHIKYEYYGVRSEFTGTAYVNLEDGVMPRYIDFHFNKNIDETIASLKSNLMIGLFAFWFFWVLLIAALCYGVICLCGYIE